MDIVQKAIVTEGKSKLAEFINEKTGRICHGTYFHVVAEHRCDEIDCDCHITQPKWKSRQSHAAWLKGQTVHVHRIDDFHLPKTMGKKAVIEYLNNWIGVATEDITWTKQN